MADNSFIIFLKFYFILFFIEVQLLCSVVLLSTVSRVNQPYVCIHPPFSGFPSHVGHHRAPGGDPGAMQQVLLSYLLHT